MLRFKQHQELFQKVYDECNAHAREQTAKRDQVITFYIVVCSFYLGWENTQEFAIRLVLLLVVFIIGVLCSLILINLRSWIIQYGNCAEAVSKLLAVNYSYTNINDIAAFLKVNAKKSVDTPREFILRMGNTITYGFIFITAVPFIKLFELLYSSILSVLPCAIISLLCVITYLGLLIREHFISANNALNQFDDKQITWIIRFDDIKAPTTNTDVSIYK